MAKMKKKAKDIIFYYKPGKLLQKRLQNLKMIDLLVLLLAKYAIKKEIIIILLGIPLKHLLTQDLIITMKLQVKFG